MSNALSAAQFIVNLYASTGVVSYLDDDSFFHSKNCVIEMMMLAFINRDIFMKKGEDWPWNELKLAIMHRYDWGNARSCSSYADLFMLAAGRALERKVEGIDMSVVSNAIFSSINKTLATSDIAKVLHDLKFAHFATTGQGWTADEIVERHDNEAVFLLGLLDGAEKSMADFKDTMVRLASKKDIESVFCIPEFARRYGDALRTRAAEIARLNQ